MSPNILHKSALAASVVSLAAAAIAFGQPDRTPPRGPAGMPPPPEVNPAAVHNREALRRLWRAMGERRVSIALVVDSNGRILITSGHEVGMARGLMPHFPHWGSRTGPALGTGGWYGTINGQVDAFGLVRRPGAPPFLAGLNFPEDTGFVNGGAYVADDDSIVHSSVNTASLHFQDVPFDAEAELEIRYCYATFAEGSGVMRPRMRYTFSPHTPIASGGNVVTAPLADAMQWGSMTIPAGPRAPVPHFCGITELFGPDTQGPIGLTYTQYVVPGQATGVTYSPLWQVGGQGSHLLASQTINQTTPAMWEHWFEAVTINQGGEKADRVLCIHFIVGGNDYHHDWPAIDADGEPTGPPTNTREGHTRNLLTFLDHIESQWAAAGYAPENLYFLLGPYHPKRAGGATGIFMAEKVEPAWVQLSRERPNIIAMVGPKVITAEQMEERGWYRTDTDDAHLSHAGYIGYGAHTWATAAAAVESPPENPPVPANDLCSSALPIGDGSHPFTTLGAATDGPADDLCNGGGLDQIDNDVWFTYLAPAGGVLTVGTCGSGFDTRLAVYDGAGCSAPGMLLACSDDGGCAAGTRQSRIELRVGAGRTYTIRVGGYNGSAGDGVVEVSMHACEGDFDGSGEVNSNDIIEFLTAWLADLSGATLVADFNHDDIVNSNDISAFLTAWLAAVVAGC